jgi:hypothetical protein
VNSDACTHAAVEKASADTYKALYYVVETVPVLAWQQALPNTAEPARDRNCDSCHKAAEQ